MKKEKLMKKLKSFEEEHIRRLTPHAHLKDYQRIYFPVKNHLYLMFLIEDLIKVSVLALEGMDSCFERQIKEPERSISDVLRHALDLIPIEEQEFIDKTLEVLDKLNNNNKI
ncbi:hypothetical protein [Zunongwangia sp. HGR-M22]|uniref:hypothetical protein n=1 Tax=Zunongwangia sp. HGR-M22 TaxID=3015168 RepID=UPI0022DD96BE|nr:hypothetical protein [Zunongwangia sp. HGR-M22]WBL27258.1 hypothetical protein PBT91_08265 [Zunongwangia sp. HGR-M22]